MALQKFWFVQECHSFPAEFVCHTRLWMHKSNCLILQLVLILAWGGFAPLGSQIKYILSVRKWLFMLTYCMKCLIIHSWKLAECDYSPRYINSSWCFTALPQENTSLKCMQSFYGLLGKYLAENGPSLPACTFTDGGSLVFKATVLNWRMKMFLGQCGTEVSCHLCCDLSPSGSELGWWRANTAYLLHGEE